MVGAEFYGQLNCLKSGIVCADSLTTVSPRYAREITTEELGCGPQNPKTPIDSKRFVKWYNNYIMKNSAKKL